MFCSLFGDMTTPGYWKNGLAGHTTKFRKPIHLKDKPISNVVKEYARYCTLHGIQYVFKENSTFLERFVWLAIVLTSFICASLLMNTVWIRFSTSPTMTAVKDTHLPLYLFPFPAVSICSVDKIKRSEAYDYLSRYVNLSDMNIYHQTTHFLTAMALFQHPLYSRMNHNLKRCTKLLPVLSYINLTDFMLSTMPNCDEVFNDCFWIGQSINCCTLFQLQRTEEGFCYSFNSLTSHRSLNCPPISDAGNYKIAADTSNGLISDSNCVLRRNTAAGSSSGLEVYLKSFNSSNRIYNATKTIGVSGNRVQIFYVDEYPEAGMGNLVVTERGTKISFTVKPYITISTEAIRKLDISDRFCYFPDEHQLSISKSYTQKSCLIECRLRHLEKVCGCRPYYFHIVDDPAQVCNASQISCIADHNSELRFFSPPSVDIRGFNDSNLSSLLNCSQCLPTCHESIYDIDTAFSEETSPLAQNSYGTLDIFYRNEGAVKYQRDVTFGWIDLLVSFGGIAGLFLGFSLLSIVEFIYWSLKLLFHQISRYWNIQKHRFKRICFCKMDTTVKPDGNNYLNYVHLYPVGTTDVGHSHRWRRHHPFIGDQRIDLVKNDLNIHRQQLLLDSKFAAKEFECETKFIKTARPYPRKRYLNYVASDEPILDPKKNFKINCLFL